MSRTLALSALWLALAAPASLAHAQAIAGSGVAASEKPNSAQRPVAFAAQAPAGAALVVQLAQLAAFTQVPNRAGFAFIEQAWWVLLLLYPLATMLLCLIFRNHEQHLIDRQTLQRAQEAVAHERVFLRTLINTLPDLVWLKDPEWTKRRT